MNNHTPGPWATETWTYEVDRDIPTIRTAGDAIAQALDLWRDGADSTAERDANARLIAAAPDLLAALEEMVSEHDTYWRNTVADNPGYFPPDDTGGLVLARAAIAKAKGETL